jgi:hypothetical protein
MFDVGDKSNKADEFEDTHDPEDDEEIELADIGIGSPEDERGQGQGDEDGIEAIPGVVEKVESSVGFYFVDDFEEENNGKEVIGDFEDLVVGIGRAKSQ